MQRLATALSALAARMDAGDAARAVTSLVQVMKDTKNPRALSCLVQGLSAVAACMEAREGSAVTAQGVIILVLAMKDTKDPFTLLWLAQGLSAVPARMEAGDAALAAASFARAMNETREAVALYWLAQGLAGAAAGVEGKDAAPLTAQAATTLLQVMNDTREPIALSGLAQGLAMVAAHMEAEDAARVAGQAAALLTRTMNDTKQAPALKLAEGLSALLTAVPPAALPTRSATAASAVAFPAGSSHPCTALALLIPAAEPPSCRLSPQQLVELLKMPTCIGEARRIILDQLGYREKRHFADVWEFVRFAKEQNLDLDFTTPPHGPAPVAPATPKP